MPVIPRDRPDRARPWHPPSTVNQLLAAAAREFPIAPAILAPDRDVLTHEALARRLETTAQALAAAGFGHRSRVAVALPDGPEYAVALLAVSGCATCAPVSPDLDEAALTRLFASMRIDALIAPDAVDSPAARAARSGGIVTFGLRFSPTTPAGTFDLVTPPGRSPVAVRLPALDDTALLMHTSGTTSAPKIVRLTQRVLAEAVRTRVRLASIGPADRCLLMTRLSNAAGIRRSLLPALVVGGSVVCVPGFDAAAFLDWLARFEPTYYMASVATQVAIVEELERVHAPAGSSLRFALLGGAHLPSAVADRLERALGAPVIRGYGCTETGVLAQAPFPPERAPAGSVGRPTNVDLVIADENGNALGVGAIGEVVVRGPEVIDQYENDDEANAAAFRDGWFRTGDLGRVDQEGFLFLAGRIKDVINRGGSKVAPSEVDDALASHPEVVEAAAFALPHPTLGEDVAAAVVLRTPGAVTEDALREYVRGTLAAYKVPTRIVALDALPRGSFGKVRRGELATIAARFLQTEFVAPRDDEEAEVVRIFADVLGLQRVGVLDNFFQLGGDSLRGARAVAQAQMRLDSPVALAALFREPTAAGFTAAIRDARSRPEIAAPPSINRIPRQSTDEVEPLKPGYFAPDPG